jgi:hypothetical protein
VLQIQDYLESKLADCPIGQHETMIFPNKNKYEKCMHAKNKNWIVAIS